MTHYKFISLKSTLFDPSVFKSSYALSIHLSVLKLALIPKVLIITFPVKDVATMSAEKVFFELSIVNKLVTLESAKALFESVFHLSSI